MIPQTFTVTSPPHYTPGRPPHIVDLATPSRPSAEQSAAISPPTGQRDDRAGGCGGKGGRLDVVDTTLRDFCVSFRLTDRKL